MTETTLYVSLFDSLTLRNLPDGCFERRTLSPMEALHYIDVARSNGRLLGVSRDDLEIDERAMSHTRELLSALNTLPSPIHLHVSDFVEGGSNYFRPLDSAVVTRDASLLSITCAYEWVRPGVAPGAFCIAAGSLSFALFETA